MARRRTVISNQARLAGDEIGESALLQRRHRRLSAAAAAAAVEMPVPVGDQASAPEGGGRRDGCRGSAPCQNRVWRSAAPTSLGGESARAFLLPPAQVELAGRGGGSGGFGHADGIGSGLSRRSLLAWDSKAREVVGTVILADNGSTAISRKTNPLRSVGAEAEAGARTAETGVEKEEHEEATGSAETAEVSGAAPVPPLDSLDSGDGNEEGKGEDGGAATGWRINPEDPIPPPACPSRLVELLEEALRVEARPRKVVTGSGSTSAASKPEPIPGADAALAATAGTGAGDSADHTAGHANRGDGVGRDNAAPDVGWSPAAMAALMVDGAAAAADRARSRAERGDGVGDTLGRARWEASLGRGVLPTWLAGAAGVEWKEETARTKATGAATAGPAGAVSSSAVLPQSVVAKQALGSGFQAIAAYRAHEVEGWNEGGDAGGGGGGVSSSSGGVAQRPGGAAPEIANGDGSTAAAKTTDGGSTRSTTQPPDGSSNEGEAEGSTAQGEAGARLLPVRLTGFTWDGTTVVAKETVAGCARTARPAPLAPLSAPPWDTWGSSEWEREDEGGGGGGEGSLSRMDYDDSAFFGERAKDVAAAAATLADAAVPGKDGDRGGDGGSARRHGDRGGGVNPSSPPCLEVEAAFVPTESIVVDIVVPVRDRSNQASVAFSLFVLGSGIHLAVCSTSTRVADGTKRNKNRT